MEKKEKKPKSKTRKILEWVFTGVFLALIGVVAGFRIYQAVTKNYSIFGSQYPVVLTDSMEDTYMVGDVLIIKEVDPSEVKEGDDVSFYWNVNGTEMMMTHRLQSVTYDEGDSNGDGYYYTFVAHGINTHSEYCRNSAGEYDDCTYQTQTFHEDKFIGKVTGTSGFLTVMNKIFTSVWTLILLILIPSLYLIISSVITLFKQLPDDDEQELATEPSKEDLLAGMSEEDRKRLKQEMLDEMLENVGKGKDDKKAK